MFLSSCFLFGEKKNPPLGQDGSQPSKKILCLRFIIIQIFPPCFPKKKGRKRAHRAAASSSRVESLMMKCNGSSTTGSPTKKKKPKKREELVRERPSMSSSSSSSWCSSRLWYKRERKREICWRREEREREREGNVICIWAREMMDRPMEAKSTVSPLKEDEKPAAAAAAGWMLSLDMCWQHRLM